MMIWMFNGCNKELEVPSIKSLAEGLRITDQLRFFAQFNGYQDLALDVGKEK